MDLPAGEASSTFRMLLLRRSLEPNGHAPDSPFDAERGVFPKKLFRSALGRPASQRNRNGTAGLLHPRHSVRAA